MQMSHLHRRLAAWLLTFTVLVAPMVGCSRTEEAVATTVTTQTEDVLGPIKADNESSVLNSTWNVISETTESGLTLVSENCSAGSQVVMDATKTVWISSTDATADGWGWIVQNAGDATEWASDTANQTWTVTKTASGDVSLWVQVKTQDGVAWARTNLPEAWEVSKDAAGNAWIWVGDHKVEVAVAAAVVTVVVAGLIVAPEGVGPAVVKGAVSGSATHTSTFLIAAWKDYEKSGQFNPSELVSRDAFVNIGKSVIVQCGRQVVGELPMSSGT